MKSKKTVLKDIILKNGIASGYSFRGKIKSSLNGDVRVVQLKDMEDDYLKIGNYCTYIDGTSIKNKYYLEFGDILFISKGSNNFAVVYDLKDEVVTIASSVFYVIKVDTSKANPFYVAWYINKTRVQQYFITHASGTYSLSINKNIVEQIPIRLPCMEIQKKIAMVSKLAQREQVIYTSLQEKRNQLIEAQLFKAIN